MSIQQSIGFNLAREEEKQAKISIINDLRREYINLYTQRDAMITNERDTIYCRYISLLGKARYENFKLSVEVRVLKNEGRAGSLRPQPQPDPGLGRDRKNMPRKVQ